MLSLDSQCSAKHWARHLYQLPLSGRLPAAKSDIVEHRLKQAGLMRFHVFLVAQITQFRYGLFQRKPHVQNRTLHPVS